MNKDKRNLPRDSRHNRVPRNVNLQEEYQSKEKGGDHLDVLDSDADVTLDMFTYVCFAVPCFLNLFEVSLQVLSYIFHHFSYYLHKSCSMIPRGSTCPGSATSRIATPSGS